MAEGAASREGLVPLDVAGSEDDPRAGPDPGSVDAAAAAAGGRLRDRRSGVALPGAAGAPADSEAGLLEAARATPRRSSIIKVTGAGQRLERRARGVGGGRIGDWAGGVMSRAGAGSALFSHASLAAEPSFLVRRFPDSWP